MNAKQELDKLFMLGHLASKLNDEDKMMFVRLMKIIREEGIIEGFTQKQDEINKEGK